MQEERNARHARRQTRAFLQLLHDSLGQPPMDASMRTVLVGVVNMLAERDLGRRWAAREAIADLMERYGG